MYIWVGHAFKKNSPRMRKLNETLLIKPAQKNKIKKSKIKKLIAETSIDGNHITNKILHMYEMF